MRTSVLCPNQIPCGELTTKYSETVLVVGPFSLSKLEIKAAAHMKTHLADNVYCIVFAKQQSINRI